MCAVMCDSHLWSTYIRRWQTETSRMHQSLWETWIWLIRNKRQWCASSCYFELYCTVLYVTVVDCSSNDLYLTYMDNLVWRVFYSVEFEKYSTLKSPIMTRGLYYWVTSHDLWRLQEFAENLAAVSGGCKSRVPQLEQRVRSRSRYALKLEAFCHSKLLFLTSLDPQSVLPCRSHFGRRLDWV